MNLSYAGKLLSLPCVKSQEVLFDWDISTWNFNKVCSLHMQQHISQAASEIGLLVGNILVQDLVDANPSVRATAISAICSVSVLSNQYAFQAISNGLKLS